MAPNQGGPTMQYLLLIYESEAEASARGQAGLTEMVSEYRTFTQSIIRGGQFRAGNVLKPTSTATTVRVRDGKTLTTDGPSSRCLTSASTACSPSFIWSSTKVTP